MRSNLATIQADDDVWRAAFLARIQAGDFSFARQPIVALSDRSARHDELFVRFGAESPMPIIERAERLGLMGALDFAVVDSAIRYLDVAESNRGLAVNLSGASITDSGVMDLLLTRLAATRFPRTWLSFEITESAEIADLACANAAIQRLRARGHAVCLDDFGAGFASLHYLQALEVDYVKIDGRYMERAMEGERERRMFRAILALCGELGVSTIAERIETEAQAAFAAELGVSGGQGYFLAKPMPFPEMRPQALSPIAAA
jgi:EAL domain-containing protein (putative c-di-GMP-specific phosphodiesterase class I)